MKKRNDYTPGRVYIIHDSKANLYKVGLSRNPARRLSFLKETYGNHLQLLQTIWTFNMRWLEHSLHKQFKTQKQYRGKVDGGTEWFRLKTHELLHLRFMLMAKGFGINASYIVVVLAGISAMYFAATTSLLDFNREQTNPTNHPKTDRSRVLSPASQHR